MEEVMWCPCGTLFYPFHVSKGGLKHVTRWWHNVIGCLNCDEVTPTSWSSGFLNRHIVEKSQYFTNGRTWQDESTYTSNWSKDSL